MRAFRRFVSVVGTVALLLLSPVTVADELQEYIDTVCRRDCVRSTPLMRAVSDASSTYSLDPVSVLAIIAVESSFRPRATNGSSVGLTQVLKRLHREKFNGKDPFDIRANVFAGMRVLSDCLVKHKGFYKQAYRCYNGYGAKSIKYAAKVNTTYNDIKRLNLSNGKVDELDRWVNSFYHHEDQQ